MAADAPLWQLAQTEAQFQVAVQQYATMRGWSWMHIQKMGNDRGYWRTPIVGNLGQGWPDLVLVRGERLVFAEIKGEKGKLSPFQAEVLESIRHTDNEVYVWKPSDWPTIEEVLR